MRDVKAIDIEKLFRAFGKCFSDNMEPTLRVGDDLIVNTAVDRLDREGIYVLAFGEAVVIRRAQPHAKGWLLINDNKRYDGETVPAEEIHTLRVLGRVEIVGRAV